MEQLWAALDASWQVLMVALVLGAGLPALFAFGIRALAWGTGGEAEVHDAGVTLKPHPVGRAVAITIFTVVVAAVLLGVSYIVAHGLGWTITFDGLLPVLKPKG